MALSFSTLTTPRGVPAIFGSERVSQLDVTLDASYALGGVTLTAAQLGLAAVLYGLNCQVITPTAAAVVNGVILPQTDGSAKLKLFTSTAELGAGLGTGTVIRVTVAGY